MLKLRGSRALVARQVWFGLSLGDFIAAMVVFWIGNFISIGTKFELASIFLGVGVIAVLLPIRLKYRRKIIRDWLIFNVRSEKFYDPSANRVPTTKRV